MNALAMMNSTTIDYNTQLETINDSRASLERYIETDKLINELGHNVSLSQNEVSSILDKSYILPIYERNFDKIAQIAKSDFNSNEGDLAMKYSKAYMDFVEQQKKEELNINPLGLASQIESGIVSMLTKIGSGSGSGSGSRGEGIKTKADITGEYGDNWYYNNGELREQLTRDYGFTNIGDVSGVGIRQAANNPIPKQERTNSSLDVEFNRENIFRDPSNRGSYMINSKAQGDILEGFANKPSTTSPSLIRAFDDSGKNKKGENRDQDSSYGLDLPSKLLSGDFLQYMLDTINGYMTAGYGMYKGKLDDYLGVKTGFKLEDNMIPAGFALFILSMLLYFVDLTS
jgi:hypothetical protein